MTAPVQPTSAPSPGLSAPPTLRTHLDASEVLACLERLAIKGRLPGFAAIPDEARFEVALFGDPFDRVLVGAIRDGKAGGQRTVDFTFRLKRRIPIFFIVTIALTIWPGVVLTDALIPGAWGWWPTWWWYMPLVIVPLPFMLPRMWKKSEASAADHLIEQYDRICTALHAGPADESE